MLLGSDQSIHSQKLYVKHNGEGKLIILKPGIQLYVWGHTRQCPRASSGRKYPSRSPDDCNRQVLILIKYNSIRNWNCNYWSHGLLGIIVGNSVIVIITNLEEIKIKSFRNPSFIMITINDNFRN